MKLYDNDSYRDTFTEAVYSLLSDDPMWDRANQIIDLYDSATAVEVPDSTLGGTYVNVEWLRAKEVQGAGRTPSWWPWGWQYRDREAG